MRTFPLFVVIFLFLSCESKPQPQEPIPPRRGQIWENLLTRERYRIDLIETLGNLNRQNPLLVDHIFGDMKTQYINQFSSERFVVLIYATDRVPSKMELLITFEDNYRRISP